MPSPNDIPGFDKLAPLESVEFGAFRSEDNQEQEVCNFILVLALAHNDLKDLSWAYKNLKDYEPAEPEISPACGQLIGIKWHVIKLLYSLVFEVCKLVTNPRNQTLVLSHPLFHKTFNRMSDENRQRWNDLIDFARDTPKDNKLMNILVKVRNNISFHYMDADALGQGYQKFFAGKGSGRDAAYVSRGKNMESSRFYFADAAVFGKFEHLIEGQSLEIIQEQVADELRRQTENINKAIFNLVTMFVQARHFAWYQVKPP